MREGRPKRRLTLSLDQEAIDLAKRLAEQTGTTVSVLFERFIRSQASSANPSYDVPPDSIAARMTGIIKLPEGKTWQDVLTEALMEKYGIDPDSGK